MNLSAQVIEQAIDWIQDGTESTVEKVVCMEMDEVSYATGSFPWCPENVAAMIAEVEAAIA